MHVFISSLPASQMFFASKVCVDVSESTPLVIVAPGMPVSCHYKWIPKSPITNAHQHTLSLTVSSVVVPVWHCSEDSEPFIDVADFASKCLTQQSA